VVVIAKHRALLEPLGLATLEEVKAFGAGPKSPSPKVGPASSLPSPLAPGSRSGAGKMPAQGRTLAFKSVLVKDHHGRRDVFRIETQRPDGSPLVLFLKRTWRPYKKDGLRTLLRHGRVWSIARQEWENSLALQQAGLRTAELVAYGEECGLCWERFSFIVTEAAAGAQTIEQFLRDCRDPLARRRAFDRLAAEVRRLHDAGLATPDLFTRHIFLNADSDPPGLCFIDMARLDRRTRVSRRLAARDLAALNVSAPLRDVALRERLRLLRVYAGRFDRELRKRIVTRTTRLLRKRRFQTFFKNSEPKVK
jgi:tRNA A-37 threonylcarbamoyl transferase component Bud32